MTSLKLSVIVPVYNVERYLGDCINSLINQDYESYEVILVDDGSTDSSANICDDYQSKHPEIIRAFHKNNGGLGSARNYGMDKALGEYALFLDSDDYLEFNCVPKMMKIILEDDLDILLFGAEGFSDDGSSYQRDSYLRKTTQFGKVFSGYSGIVHALRCKEYYTSVCLRVYRLEFLRNTRIRFNEKYIHEDEDFSFLTYLLAKKTETIADSYYKRRYREGSIMSSRSFRKSFDGYRYAILSIKKYKAILNKNKQELCELYCQRLMLSIIYVYMSLPETMRGNEKQQLLNYLNRFNNTRIFDRRLKLAIANFNSFEYLQKVKQIGKPIVKRAISSMKIIKNEPEDFKQLVQMHISRPKIFLIGTPHHGNIGDHLIAQSEIDFLMDVCPGRLIVLSRTLPVPIFRFFRQIKRRYGLR